MFRLSRGEHANQVPHPRANLAFTLFTLGAVVNNAAIEGFGSSVESVRNVTTLALIGFAAISFLKMRKNVDATAMFSSASVNESPEDYKYEMALVDEAVQQKLAEQKQREDAELDRLLAATTSRTETSWEASAGIIQGVAARPLIEILPVISAEEAAAIRAHSAAILNQPLNEQ